MVRIRFAQISDLMGHDAVNDAQLAIKKAVLLSHPGHKAIVDPR